MRKKYRRTQCQSTEWGSQTCPNPFKRRPLGVSEKIEESLTSFLLVVVCHRASNEQKYDKELASRIQFLIKAEKDLEDETAGWHVICGKSFASAITYETEWVFFFDLLEDQHKTFLMFKTQWDPYDILFNLNRRIWRLPRINITLPGSLKTCCFTSLAHVDPLELDEEQV